VVRNRSAPPSTGGRAVGTAEHEVEAGLHFHTRHVRRKEFRLHQVSLFESIKAIKGSEYLKSPTT